MRGPVDPFFRRRARPVHLCRLTASKWPFFGFSCRQHIDPKARDLLASSGTLRVNERKSSGHGSCLYFWSFRLAVKPSHSTPTLALER